MSSLAEQIRERAGFILDRPISVAEVDGWADKVEALEFSVEYWAIVKAENVNLKARIKALEDSGET